jgi:MFS family permease
VLIGALAVSIFGSGMWAVAMVYQVIHIGGGPLELSLVATAGSVGLVAFVLAGGIAADRVPQRLLIIAVEGTNLAVIAGISGLAMAGWLQLWHLAAGAFVLGVGAAFFFPAYSAILPRILPAEDLLAANGMEGSMRPILQQAAGPAVAGIVVAALSPSHAVTGVAVCHLVAFIILNFLGQHALDAPANGADHGSPAAPAGGHTVTPHARKSFFHDLREGVGYTLRTPWLLWTLLWACISVLFLIGPIEVLLPFVVRDQGAVPHFDPRLPEEWDSLSFHLKLQGRLLLVELDPAAITLSVLDGELLDVDVRGEVWSVGADPVRVALDPVEVPEPSVFPSGPPTASLPVVRARA